MEQAIVGIVIVTVLVGGGRLFGSAFKNYRDKDGKIL